LSITQISVLAVETEGAGSFHAASKAGKVVAIPAITSIASSLGALSVTESVLDDSVVTEPLLVSDTEAVQACLSLIQSDRVLVEPACGAAIAALQGAVVPRWLDGAADTGIFQGKGKLAGRKIEKVVVIVCGGSAVNLDMMQGWKQKFSL
jgi:L-serine/L-threonine ammonia-lyase